MNSSPPGFPPYKIPASSDLIVESDVGPEVAEFRPEQEKSLAAVVETIAQAGLPKTQAESWLIAKRKVEQFRPLPWFLWRLSLSVFSKPIGTYEVNEGMILGLRRLLFAAASDPMIGSGSKVNSVKKALSILPADVIAAVSIVHSVCRRLRSFDHDSIWRPILDEALIHAQIGHHLGACAKNFMRGRGILAGFASQIGIAILIAGGDKTQAAEVIGKLAEGELPSLIGREVYGCEPLQISAMLLGACGCGPEAASGVSAAGQKASEILDLPAVRSSWAGACQAVELLRNKKSSLINIGILNELGMAESDLDALSQKAVTIARAGHSWHWIE